ncbi:iron ABC transporter permease [Ferrovibrio terrae]|uniref:Iron ABC transporter permease n=1 Tax=Ferrovibrio terrae TaxID=2594003 RepID=A0A516H7V9_9PROT|nr:iron ABC transporter permease [Ferrovibrio terrae]
MTDLAAPPSLPSTSLLPLRNRQTAAWLAFAALVALVIAAPILAILINLGRPAPDVWQHLVSTVLPEMLRNTVLMMVGVGLGAMVIGTGCAWLVTMTEFPGRRLLSWALFLPLAMPAYVSAFVYSDLLQFAGPVQTALRHAFGWQRGDYWFPDFMSLNGAIALFVFGFYPYVFMLARAAFLDQSVCVLEVGRTLGLGPWTRFWRIALPLARPMIAGGVALVLMETLADFGAVSWLGVPTFTTAIYRTWFGMGDVTAAAQLAAVLLIFVLAAVMLERASRQAKRFHHTSARTRPLPLRPLRPLQATLAILACFLPILLGFLLPGGWLFHLAWVEGDGFSFGRLAGFTVNSFVLAGVSAVLLIVVALGLAYMHRVANNRAASWLIRLATMGYAVPGSVIAIGVLLPLAAFDHVVDHWAYSLFGVSSGLLLSGTVAALFYAYLVRFLAVAFNAVDGGLHRIRPSLDQAARVLGETPLGVVRRVHAPLLRGSLMTAALLVFVDVLKELPATMIVRPFDFDTLAVRVYQLASDERLAEASTGSLIIVAVSLIPVIWLHRVVARSRPGDSP